MPVYCGPFCSHLVLSPSSDIWRRWRKCRACLSKTFEGPIWSHPCDFSVLVSNTLRYKGVRPSDGRILWGFCPSHPCLVFTHLRWGRLRTFPISTWGWHPTVLLCLKINIRPIDHKCLEAPPRTDLSQALGLTFHRPYWPGVYWWTLSTLIPSSYSLLNQAYACRPWPSMCFHSWSPCTHVEVKGWQIQGLRFSFILTVHVCVCVCVCVCIGRYMCPALEWRKVNYSELILAFHQ